MARNLNKKISGSFRDPDGFLFEEDGQIYRQINQSYKPNYDLLMSELYNDLVDAELLIPHKEVQKPKEVDVYKVIQPEMIGLISYAYEWAFSQYKDAALTTLEIQRRCLESGMSLKDASAYNIQFHNGQPIFIDTLSFEQYEDGKPWQAYRQFCQHFLAPLALMAHVDVDLSKLMKVYIDGIPLSLTSKLLPKKTLAGSLGAHIHLHARSQKKYESSGNKARSVTMSKSSQAALIQNLAGTIKKLTWKPKGTEWGEYYTFTNYDDKAFKAKQKLVKKMALSTKPESVWDIGANDGSFSRLVSEEGIKTRAFDIDPIAVEKNYLHVKQKGEKYILPLVMDLTNPSSEIGWANRERKSMTERGPADLVMALALVHHLAISNNLPLESIAEWLADIGRNVLIEFVPKEDSQVKKLFASRPDIFPQYNEHDFEIAMKTKFKILEKRQVTGSKRTLYLMEIREQSKE